MISVLRPRWSRLLIFLLLLCSLAGANQQVKNVILMIGDGMGANQRLAASLHLERSLAMDGGVKRMITTYSANNSVTDSAAGATALATGKKTNNNRVSIGPDLEILPTILELAKEKGLAVGLVVTDSMTGATPAAFAAHQRSRSDHQRIANDYFTNKVDLLFGGGREWFLPADKGGKRTDGRDLVVEFQNTGYHYLENSVQLNKLSSLPVIGLLNRGSLPNGTDLAQMTKKAIELMSQTDQGFFLMVEGSQIDNACHSNNLSLCISEVVAFEEAVVEALEFAKDHPQTLVVVTADHETGGLNYVDGRFEWSTTGHTGIPVPLNAFGAGAELFNSVSDNTHVPQIIAKLLGLELSIGENLDI